MDLRLKPAAVRRSLSLLGIPAEQQTPEALRRLVPPELSQSLADVEPELWGELFVHWAGRGLVPFPQAPAASAIERVSRGTHSCHIYRDPASLIEIAVPWMRAGIAAGEYCLWIVPRSVGVKDAIEALSVFVEDLAERRARRQLEVIAAEAWYFQPDGRVKSEAEMGEAWVSKVEHARSIGCPGMRAVGDMSWIAGRSDLERFLAYERRCNELAAQLPLAGLCTYHVDSLPGEALGEIGDAHERCFVKSEDVWHRLEGDPGQTRVALQSLRRNAPVVGGKQYARPSFAGRLFPPNRHLCGFFRGPQDRHATLLPFIKEGLDRGEKVVHIIKRDGHTDHLELLAGAGIEVERALSSGQLEIFDWEATYLRGGRFDMDKMPALIADLIARSREEGYPLLRAIGNMEWSLESCAGVEDVLRYESKLHSLLLKYPDPVVCCYDIGRYSAEFVVDVLRVHQVALVCGILSDNPYFVPPEKYLADVEARS